MECEILDCEAENLDVADILKKIEEYKPSVIGISSTSPMIEKANYIASKIKEFFKIPIVLGGNHITLVGGEAMKGNKFDFGVIGEGEEIFPKLVTAIKNGEEYIKKVPNIIIRENSRLIPTYRDNRPLDLDSISFPDRSKIKTKKYKRIVRDRIKTFTSIKASRGCPFDCYFCSESIIYPAKVRFRSPDNIIQEIDEISINFPEIEHIFFNDDTLTLKRKWIIELLDKIIERKYKITFEGETIVRYFDEIICEKMAKAGFESIFFGIETGAPEIIKNIGKNITLEQVRKAVKIAKSFGLVTRGSVIIGHPFETKETIKKTIEFICSLDELDEVYVNIATPYPGTKLRAIAEEEIGGLKLTNKSYSALSKYEPVIELEGITSEELKRYQKIAIIKFYSKPNRIISYMKRLKAKDAIQIIKNAFIFVLTILWKGIREKLIRSLKTKNNQIRKSLIKNL